MKHHGMAYRRTYSARVPAGQAELRDTAISFRESVIGTA